MSDPEAWPVSRSYLLPGETPEAEDDGIRGERYYKRKLKKAGILVKKVRIFGSLFGGYGETYLLPYCWNSHGIVDLFDGQVYKSYYSIYHKYLLIAMKEFKGGME